MPSAQLTKAALVLSLAACAAPWTVTAVQAQPAIQPAPRTVTAVQAQPAIQPAPRTVTKPAVRPAPAPATQPAARPAASPDTRGFLYGRLTTRGGTAYEGRLRWGKEEAFWGDLFHSSKTKNPYLDLVPEKDRREARRIEIFGVPIGVHWEEHETRQFVARFGDIRKIEPGRGGYVVVHLKSGSRHQVEGGSNDVGGTVVVWDRSLDQVEVDWDDIASIDFLPAPAKLAVGAHRLYGTVKTRDGNFRGFLQWDQDEGLSTDELDGEARDGKLSIPLGNIRAIERHQLSRADVTLHDGRTLTMSGTNDVNGDNRGVYVDDPRFGRVLISWQAFERVDFSPPPGSGPSYTDYLPGRPLRGKVTARDGKVYSGRLVYDADEAETIELLDGDRNDISYAIPFAKVAFLLPEPSGTCRVILKDGNELKLEETVDVTEDNAGVLVYAKGQQKPRHIAWRDVRRIDFE